MYVFGVPLFGDLLESLLVSSYGGVVMKVLQGECVRYKIIVTII